MKNFLSNLWSLLVGSRKDDGSTRLRVDYDSFTCRLRVWPLKLVSVLAILLTIGIGNAWGTDFTLSSASSVTQDGITVSFAKGDGGTAPTWYAAGLRLYASNTVTISSSVNITSITFNWEKQGSKAFASASASTGTYSHPAAAGEGTWTGSATSITFTLGSSGQLQLNTLSVTVAASSCGTDPIVGNIMNNVTGVTARGATFSTSTGVSAGTNCSLSAVGFVYGTSSNPTTSNSVATIDDYTSGALNKSVTGLNPSTTYYVRAYATNSHGTTYSDQKSFTTSALQTYTITFSTASGYGSVTGGKIDATNLSYNGSGMVTNTLTEGQTLTFPSVSSFSSDDCYTTFRGWTTDPLSSTAPTIKAGDELELSGATTTRTYYAVYSQADEAGGEFDPDDDIDGDYYIANSDKSYYMSHSVYSTSYFYATAAASKSASSNLFHITKNNANKFVISFDNSGTTTYVKVYTSSNNHYVGTTTTAGEATAFSIAAATEEAIGTYEVGYGNAGRGLMYRYVNSTHRFANYSISTNRNTDNYSLIEFEPAVALTYTTNPSCTSKLGSINGSINMTSSAANTITIKDWTEISNVSSYTVKLYKKNGGGTWDLVSGTAASASAGSQGTRTGLSNSNRTGGVTFNGLTYGATYKFTVTAIGDGVSFSDGDETAVTSINSNSLTNNEFLNKYSIYIDDGTNHNYAHNYITSLDGSNNGSVSITLESDIDYYQYQLTLGGAVWWGNTGKMTSANCSGWTFTAGASNCKIQTAVGGPYTFALTSATPAISVTYPVANQTAGYPIYFDKSVITGWNSEGTSDIYLRIGKPTNNKNNTTDDVSWSLVPGTDRFYTINTLAYDGFEAWQIANNVSWSGDNSIYLVNPDGTTYDITKATNFQKYVVGSSGVTIVPTTSNNTENGCNYWNVSKTDGMLTHTATITTPTNGTINLAYTNTSGTSCPTNTSTVSGLAHRTILTITATPVTGYNLGSLTVNGAAFTSGNTHVLAADATIAATFSAKTYSITLEREGADNGSTSVTMTYNSSSHTDITAPTKDGYSFGGWWTEDDGTGTMVMNASGVLQANVAGYTGAGGIWTKDAECTLYAKWEASKQFILATNSTTLVDGDEIVIMNLSSTYAMSTTQESDYRGYTNTGLSVDGTTLTVNATSDAQIIFLEESDSYLLFNVGGYNYLCGNNNLKTKDITKDEMAGDWEWNYSIDNENKANIYSNGDHANKYLQYNSGSPRFKCYSSGNQQKVKIYCHHISTPFVRCNPDALQTFQYAVGYGPSLAQALQIKGYNLTGNLTVTCPSGYELSSTYNSSDFSTSNITLTPSSNRVNATIYIRLAAGKSVDSYNANLAISGGGITTTNVPLVGSVTAADGTGDMYVALVDESDLFPGDEMVLLNDTGTWIMNNTNLGGNNQRASNSGFIFKGTTVYVTDSYAAVQKITTEESGVANRWLLKAGDKYLYAASASDNYLKTATTKTTATDGHKGEWQIETNATGIATINAPESSMRNIINFNFNSGGGNRLFSCYNRFINRKHGGTTLYYRTIPNIWCQPSTLTGFSVDYGAGASTAQSFTVKAKNIVSGNVTVTAPTGYEVSQTSSTTGFADSQTLTPTNGKIASATIWVRIKAGNEAGDYNDNITVAATNVAAETRYVALTGVVNPVPNITLDATSSTPLVTSRYGVNIMATNTLTLNISGAVPGEAVSFTAAGLKFYKKITESPAHYVELTGGNALTAPVTNQVVYVSYNPTSAGTGAITSPDIQVSCNGTTGTFSGKIKVRNLPDAVAIVAKVNNAWQALPANMSGAQNPEAVTVAVTTDGGVLKAYGVNTLAYKLWPVKTTNGSGDRFGTYSSPDALYADRVRFSGNSNKGLWANDNSATSTIKNDAGITEVGSDPASAYEWIITTSEVDGQFVYTLQSAHGSNTNYLRYWTAASGGPKWGTYVSGISNLYILPLEEVQEASITVMEWGTNELAVRYPNAGNVASGTFKAMIDGGDKTSVTATSLGGDMYKLTGVGDLQANPAKILTLSMTESSTAKQALFVLPLIVTAEKTEAELSSYAAGGDGSSLLTEGREIAKNLDVIVRNGGKLTTGTASGHFADLYVYPGGKAKITKNFSARNVYLRGGYSFLDNKATYKYPDLCVQDDGGTTTITTAGVKYDMYIDNRYYYTFAMPYDVTLASVTDEVGNDDFPVWVKHYNGDIRASGTHVTGWEWYGDYKVVGKEDQDRFYAGIGYEITAKPKTSGRPIAIIRFPVKSGNITTDAAHAVGVSVSNYGYDNYESGSLAANNVGWNLVGNPYFTEYKAGSVSGEGDTLMIIAKDFVQNIDETTNVWDGTYKWSDANTARFITVPYDTQTDYHAEYVHDYTIPAFSAFFIQTSEAGTFYMRGTRTQAAAAPRFGTAPKAKPELHIDVLLSGEGEAVEGKAGLLIHDKYEGGLKDFEDVEQWFVEKNELKTYTFADGTALAYNLTNEQTVVQPIQMGYIATVAGEHTYSINEANDVSALEHLWLTDNETGITTDLLARDYVFTTAAGRFDERFALSAVFKQEEVITDVGDVGDSDWTHAIGVYHEGNTLTLRGLPENSAVYIYDMTGKLTASSDRLHNAASFSIAAQGVYNIRVVNGNSAVTLRSVLR